MMHGLLAVLSLNSDIYFISMYTKVYDISLNSQQKELSEFMSYMKICKEVTKRRCQELENRFFHFYFLD